MKELTYIFEKYNGIIINCFFPDKSTMDKAMYEKVRKQILGLYDELQLRYQGVESPMAHTRSPSQDDSEKFIETAQKEGIPPEKGEEPDNMPQVKANRIPPDKVREHEERMAKRKSEAKDRNRIASAVEDSDDLTAEEATQAQQGAEARTKARKTEGTVESLFDSILSPDPRKSADLDTKTGGPTDDLRTTGGTV